jgi:hypothetical protein
MTGTAPSAASDISLSGLETVVAGQGQMWRSQADRQETVPQGTPPGRWLPGGE